MFTLEHARSFRRAIGVIALLILQTRSQIVMVVNAKLRQLYPWKETRNPCIEGWARPRVLLQGCRNCRLQRDSILGPVM